MAMACLRLFTFLPDRPLFSVPFLRSCIARSTFSDAFLAYLAICLLLLRVPGRFLCNASCVPRFCFTRSRGKDAIEGETIFVTGHDEQEEKEGQAGNDVLVERIQGLVEKVPKGDHD